MKLFIPTFAVFSWFPLSIAAAAAPPIDFNRQIAPILSENCFACHGFDAKQRKAGLRFDIKDGAFAKLPSGDRAIVAGKSSGSALVERITSVDPNHIMPPPSSLKKLKKEEIELIRRWIDDGADWKPHWAFIVPRVPALPDVKDEKWAKNSIDRFVLARLEKHQLIPAPEADKTRLIRRVTLDLTGCRRLREKWKRR